MLPKVLWDAMPIIWLVPKKKVAIDEAGRYKCPVYRKFPARIMSDYVIYRLNFNLI